MNREWLQVRLLRRINSGARSMVLRTMLWRWRVSAEDRSRLKLDNRRLQHEIDELRQEL
jgi:hypothetical protein